MSTDLHNLKRRFIAGAVCPRCKEMDSIVMYRVEGVDYRECVSCDFEERAQFEGQGHELPTRVNQDAGRDGLANPDIQVVKLLDPAKKD